VVLARYFNAVRVNQLLRFPWQSQADEFSLQFNTGKVGLNADRLLIISAWIFFPLLITALKMKGESAAILNYDWASYFRILLISGLYLILKLLVASAVGYAFEREEEILKGQNLALAHFTWLALVGGALAFVLYFLPLGSWQFYLLVLPLVLVGLIFLIRSVLYCLRIGFNTSYIILYLCALEIIPLFFLYSLV
tara:strand:- start:2732 stop:3313 length:582 start_codon:yes stop_codon:yes gene_type:complete